MLKEIGFAEQFGAEFSRKTSGSLASSRAG
jgi:hypothetical protein